MALAYTMNITRGGMLYGGGVMVCCDSMLVLALARSDVLGSKPPRIALPLHLLLVGCHAAPSFFYNELWKPHLPINSKYCPSLLRPLPPPSCWQCTPPPKHVLPLRWRRRPDLQAPLCFEKTVQPICCPHWSDLVIQPATDYSFFPLVRRAPNAQSRKVAAGGKNLQAFGKSFSRSCRRA